MVWFFLFVFLKNESIKFVFIFFILIFSLSHLLFCFSVWRDTSAWCCIKRTWKMCWIIDSKWCKCSYPRHGVIFYLFFERINLILFFTFLTHFSFCFLGWKYISTRCCIQWIWKMCWIIDSKWCKCWYSKRGVIFYLFLFVFLKELINLIVPSFFIFSPIFFLFFSLKVHLYTMLHTMDMKNVLNYWFKMVQVFIFKTRCDFLFIFWKN